MKKVFLFFFFVDLMGCMSHDNKPDILSFQNKWGVAYYIYPRYQEDGCSYRVAFLPLKNLADTSLITDSSSIFDFKYGSGINFRSGNPVFLSEIYSSNPKKYLYIKGNSNHIIYWGFMKLKYHVDTATGVPVVSSIQSDTLTSQRQNLPLQFYQLRRHIAIDTAYSKKKYINPWNNPKYQSKMNKYIMPCSYLHTILGKRRGVS
jgi:hypothetical protein